MKNFWNISLFKVSILLIFTLFTKNIFIMIITILYLAISKNYKELMTYIIALSLSLLISSINKPILKVGIVDTKSGSSYIVNSILYKTKLSNNEDLSVGDVVLLDDTSNKTENTTYLKKQIIFTNSNKVEKLYTLKLTKYIDDKIESFDDNTKAILKNILFNEYNDTELSISFGFCFYYLFMFLYKRNKKISYVSLILYIVYFGFEVKLLLIFLTLLANKFNINSKDKLGFKIICLLIINKYLLINYSILVTLLISLIYMLDRNQKFNITLMQTLLFGYVNPIISVFYKYIIVSRVIAFVLAVITIFINPFSYIFMFYIRIISFITNLLTIEIRGKLTIISIALILMIIKMFKINNQYIKCGLVILFLVTPINNPFAKLTFIDVGQGDAILIRDKLCSGNILIDTGSEYNYYKLKRYLYSQGIYKIDKLIISHSDSDHNGNVDNLKKDFKIGEIIDSKQDISFNDKLLINLDLGTHDNDNDNSLVYYLDYYGLKYLFTGDISKSVEKTLISKYPIDVDILKVGHHGSKNSSSDFFIANILPRFSIISTNGMYSHPHKEVINILNKYEIPTLITKDCGDIEIIYTTLGPILKTSNNHFVIINT